MPIKKNNNNFNKHKSDSNFEVGTRRRPIRVLIKRCFGFYRRSDAMSATLNFLVSPTVVLFAQNR